MFIFARMLEKVTFREDVLREQLKKGFIEATDIAEYLVGQGVPFRQAHEMVGNLVKYCEATGKGFPDVTAEDLAQVGICHGLSDLSQFTVENCIRNRSSYGGTGTEDVQRQIEAGWELVKRIQEGQADSCR